MFECRSTATKKDVNRQLVSNVTVVCVSLHDLEITIIETPRANWGIGGVPADELKLNYSIDV
jgi:phenylpyruvate tautomerase PptA (4-oxalocrotonate tautomerase family)